MIAKRSLEELAIMTEGGKRLGKILDELLNFAKPGITLIQIEDLAVKLIKKAGGTPSFKTVPGYHWATCLCVNEVVVHGIPTDYSIKENDVLTIDIGMVYKGLHTDTAWTKIVKSEKQKATSEEEKKKEKFLKVGEDALWKAVAQVKAGNHIGQISRAIQDTIEGAGYSIIKSLVGHGVGKELHEDPQIPGYVRGKIENTPFIVPGMTIAVEVIYAQGRGEIVYENDDGWTLSTRDRSLSAVFEHTLAIEMDRTRLLTKVSN